MTVIKGAGAVRKRRKEIPMRDIPETVPEAKREDYERGVALLVNVTHERDEAIGRAHETLMQCDRLRAELAARDATIAALKDMLLFTEQQTKIRDAENSTRVSSYQAERDTAIHELAEADARFDVLAETLLGHIKHRAAKLMDKQSQTNGNGVIDEESERTLRMLT